jgi:hypothetical protein
VNVLTVRAANAGEENTMAFSGPASHAIDSQRGFEKLDLYTQASCLRLRLGGVWFKALAAGDVPATERAHRLIAKARSREARRSLALYGYVRGN